MNKYEKGIPFDPGYSPCYVDFYDSTHLIISEILRIKAPHQKKFQLAKIQAEIVSLINKSASFYLGCLLWGAYVAYRFEQSPVNIIENHNLSKESGNIENSSIEEYIDKTVQYIKKLDKDYKFFLKKPLNFNNKIYEIFELYKEFAVINNNFFDTKISTDVKIPEKLNYFSQYSLEELDKMEEKIFEIIKTGKLELLLETDFFI